MRIRNVCYTVFASILLFAASVFFAAPGRAQTPPGARITCTTQDVSGAGEAVRININEWSTDAQRDALVSAWTMSSSSGGGARGGRGAGGAGAGAPGRGGRGGRGRGGAAATPEAALESALKAAPTIGYLWTSETLGYSIKYAYRIPLPGGGERIILATDRRVGASSNLWKPAPSIPSSNHPFSLVELHLDPNGEGEGKGILAGNVTVDDQFKTITLDGYGALPVILKAKRVS
ncbi:MAG TPA: hypothetical protein VFY29_16525 [Terriglobia bacterium]|nr:hypothetical protein [Terriglobia bacterium]